jgi:ectoine hydroxylase-related dioxygenase (phytanoyl-CoA dioxygenase family)
MQDNPSQPTFDRPFPALTSAERCHFEIYGYVVVENTLTSDEVVACKAALYRLRSELRSLEDPSATGPRARGAFMDINHPHHCFIANLIESEPELIAYATHPRLVGMAEEVMGEEARINEINAHINSLDPDVDLTVAATYGFHRGADIDFSSHKRDGLFHCSFVKNLTNLTDLRPTDGGTVVIAGSHKVNLPREQIIAAAYKDRTMIHHVVAPAGSTLLFAESLIHATGRIESDRERVILICGYGATMLPYWEDGDVSDAFRERVPPYLRTLFLGKSHWTRNQRHRKLDQPVDDRHFVLGKWDERTRLPPRDPVRP